MLIYVSFSALTLGDLFCFCLISILWVPFLKTFILFFLKQRLLSFLLREFLQDEKFLNGTSAALQKLYTSTNWMNACLCFQISYCRNIFKCLKRYSGPFESNITVCFSFLLQIYCEVFPWNDLSAFSAVCVKTVKISGILLKLWSKTEPDLNFILVWISPLIFLCTSHVFLKVLSRWALFRDEDVVFSLYKNISKKAKLYISLLISMCWSFKWNKLEFLLIKYFW